MRGYTQLTRDERYQIYALRKAGHSQKEIAEVLRRNPSTISRELGRNKGLKGYRPEQAHRLVQNRKKERDRTRIPGGAVLVTLVERRSRLSLIALAPNKTAKAVKAAILKVLQPLSAQVHTLTYDNGKEFAYHMEIAKVLKANGYFAHPYHSWERGLNENTNGLIRQYLPKGTDFNKLTDKQVLEIMDKLNNRPRKCLLGTRHPIRYSSGSNHPLH